MKIQVPAEAIAAWDRGVKIEAIRLVREHTGLGLKESMHALESGAYSVVQTWVSGSHVLPTQARAAAARGEVIQAITLTREATGLGLKEAKELVEQSLQANQQVKSTPASTPGQARLAPGEVPSSGSTAALVAVLLAIAVAVLVYIYRG
jgi:ribosomal protein L7/L12